MNNLPFRTSIWIIPAFISLFSPLSYAAVVTRENADLKCREYEVIYIDQEQKRNNLAEALAQGAELFDETPTTGLSLVNLRIDFKNEKVILDVEQHIPFSFNRNLLSNITISAGNPKLKEYVNRLNYDYFLSRSVCVNGDQELIELK